VYPPSRFLENSLKLSNRLVQCPNFYVTLYRDDDTFIAIIAACHWLFFWHAPLEIIDRDISVCIATRYGLDGPGIESQWAVRIAAPAQTGSGAYTASCAMGTGGKAAGACRQPPTPRRAEIK
jgi:hypothetical protein